MKVTSERWFLLFTFWLVIGIGSERVYASNIDRIVEALDGYSTRVKNLRTSGSTHSKSYNPATGAFDSTLNRIVYTYTTDLKEAGRFRLDLHPYVMPWSGGASGYFEYHQRISFNGQFASKVTYKQGEPGEIHESKVAKITGSQEEAMVLFRNWLIHDLAIGLLKVGGSEGEKIRFADAVKPSSHRSAEAKPVRMSEVSREVKDGVDLVRVDFVDRAVSPCYKESVWLDPARGFFMVSRLKLYNLCVKGTPESVEYNILDGEEVAKGIWLPTRATVTHRKGDSPVQLVEFKVDALEINVPEDHETYQALIESGTYVEDKRSGASFTVGEEGFKLD